MKKLLLLGACLLALAAAPAQAQTGNTKADFVLVRILDYGTRADVFITSSPTETEHIELKTGLSGVDKSMALVNQGYYAVLQKLYQQGYTLQQTVGIPYSPGSGVTTLLFVKAR